MAREPSESELLIQPEEHLQVHEDLVLTQAELREQGV